MSTLLKLRSLFVALLGVAFLFALPSLAQAQDEIVTGLGRTSSGWSEFRDDAGAGYSHLAWRQLPWNGYNNSSCGGETRAATGDVDGGGRSEVIYGLESCGNGWFEIRDDSSGSYNHLAWRQVPWTAYNNCNGETWPAAGNLDNAGNDEIVIGLGSCANGWFEIRHGASSNYNHRAWRQVPWSAYNSRNGETRPAVGNLDGLGGEEIVIGLGRTGGGWFQIRHGAAGNYNHIAWRQVPWSSYNSSCGGTRPAAGDIDGDGRDEIVVGLDYPCNTGWFAIFDDAVNNYAFLRWKRVAWTAYNNCIGETRPAVGNVDGGTFEEIVIGLGPHRVCNNMNYPNGWYEVIEDASAGYVHKAWLQVNWSSYNGRNGETWPAVSDIKPSVVATSAEGEGVTINTKQQSEPDTIAQIFPALLPGPTQDDINASVVQGPVTEVEYYAGPKAVEIEAALEPPATAAFYSGPPQDDNFYAGPDALRMDNKLYLPVIISNQ